MTQMKSNERRRRQSVLMILLLTGLIMVGCGRRGPLIPIQLEPPALTLPIRGTPFCCGSDWRDDRQQPPKERRGP